MQPTLRPDIAYGQGAAALAQQDPHLLMAGGNFIMSNAGSGGGMLSPLTLM
jgi:hypothetical protein